MAKITDNEMLNQLVSRIENRLDNVELSLSRQIDSVVRSMSEQKEEIAEIKRRIDTVEQSLSGQQEKIKEMLKETELSMMAEIEGSKISTEDSLQKLERRINRRFKDIESDSRSTQAIARLVQDAGLSFKGTRIPYPLQGNAAIEDIKDYY